MRYVPKAYPYIIGEIGACHEGSLDEAALLIRQAASAGCHAVKFQIYEAVKLCKRRQAPQAFAMYSKYQVPLSWLYDLAVMAHGRGVDLVLSVFHAGEHCEAALDAADALKIASFESGDHELIFGCTYTQKPVIVSTGMCSLSEIQRLQEIQEFTKAPMALLHCVTSYPAPLSDLNLSTIHTYYLDGYSDHSAELTAGAIAVGNGARILEVHVRGEHTPDNNPDYAHSLNHSELSQYIISAKRSALMTGSPRSGVLPSEQQNLSYKVRTS